MAKATVQRSHVQHSIFYWGGHFGRPFPLSLQTQYFGSLSWSRSRMDTTNASGALDTGSIPVGTTKIPIS